MKVCNKLLFALEDEMYENHAIQDLKIATSSKVTKTTLRSFRNKKTHIIAVLQAVHTSPVQGAVGDGEVGDIRHVPRRVSEHGPAGQQRDEQVRQGRQKDSQESPFWYGLRGVLKQNIDFKTLGKLHV